MAWVTEEEYQAAKQVRAYEYLQTYQPGRLKKTRTRNEWQLQDHDSFKINEITSKWHWKSRGIGGMSALRFLMQVDGMGYTEAVKILCEQTPVYVSRAEPAPRKKPFSLPFPNDSFYRVRRYLNQRGIRDEVLDYCVQLGILYESAPYHNAVFVGMDEQGEAKYAFLRGIYDSRGKSFRMEQEGSNKQYSFCVPPLGKSHRVAVYEACIDALAHMTLEDGRTDKYRLSLGGIAAPKEGAERATKKMKRPDALEYFLKEHPEVTEIELCTDNDFAGRWACAQLKEQYEDKLIKLQVRGILDSPTTIGVYMSHSYYEDVFDVDKDYYSAYFSNSKITDISDNKIINCITEKDMTKMAEQLKVSMGDMFTIVEAFAVVMFILVVYLLTKIILERNSTSISMVKILGYEDREIGQLYLVATSWVVLLAVLISFVLVTELIRQIFVAFMKGYSGWIPFGISKETYVQCFILAIVSYLVVAAMQMHRIKKVPMDEALKNVE